VKAACAALALILSTTGALAGGACSSGIRTIAPAGADYQRKHDTIAHTLLDNERPTGQVTPQMYAVLDAVIDQARAELPPYPDHPSEAEAERYGRRALPIIDCVLTANGFVWGEHTVLLLSDGLTPVHAEDYREYLTGDLRRNRLVKARASHDYYAVDCDTGAFLYLGVAEALHLPLAFVVIPDHAFVRWMPGALDFETTQGTFAAPGAAGEQQRYRPFFLGRRSTYSHRHELENLTRAQIFGFHHALVAQGIRFRLAGKADPDFTPVLTAFEAAIREDPELDYPYDEIAWYYTVMRPAPEKRALALDYARRAWSLSDEPVNANTLACVRAAQGDFAAATRIEPPPDRLRHASDSEIGNRVAAMNADEIAHGKPCSEALADYTAWGAP